MLCRGWVVFNVSKELRWMLDPSYKRLEPVTSATWFEPYVWVIITRRNMAVTAPTQESNSYSTPGTFLPVILQRMIGSRWNLLREHRCLCRCCAWVISRSLNRWRWVALVFNAQVFAALQDGIMSQKLWPPRSPDLTSHGFIVWGYLKRRVYRKKTSHHRSLERQHPTEHHPHWERCFAAKGGQHATLCSDVSSGGRWTFSTLDVKSSSSSWIRVCFFLV